MEIKIKKEDYQSEISAYIIGGVFLLASMVMMYIFFFVLDNETVGGTYSGRFTGKYLFLLFGALIFFLISIMVFVQLRAEPRYEKAVLVSKEVQQYRGMDITYMIFDIMLPEGIVNYAIQKHYPCYTEGPNDFNVGQSYMISILKGNNKLVNVFPSDATEETIQYNMHDISSCDDIDESAKEALRNITVLGRHDCDVSHVYQDDLLIKRLKIIVPEFVDLTNVKEVHLVTRSAGNFGNRQFFMIDDKRQLLFRIQLDGITLGRQRFVVSDYKDRLVATLEQELFSIKKRYFIRIVDKQPVLLQRIIGLNKDYQLLGANYRIIGRSRNVTCDETSVFDSAGRLAVKVEEPQGMHESGEADIYINPDVETSEFLLMLAFCISESGRS